LKEVFICRIVFFSLFIADFATGFHRMADTCSSNFAKEIILFARPVLLLVV
jgi:hypothetical protein